MGRSPGSAKGGEGLIQLCWDRTAWRVLDDRVSPQVTHDAPPRALPTREKHGGDAADPIAFGSFVLDHCTLGPIDIRGGTRWAP